MNKRKPQLIIDPNADLASAPLRFVGHNDWIYQADSSAAQLDAPQVASAPRATPTRTAASNSKRQILERYADGKPKEGWDENGKLVEQAEFFEGRQVNFDESSKANAIPATAKKTESTNVESSLR